MCTLEKFLKSNRSKVILKDPEKNLLSLEIIELQNDMLKINYALRQWLVLEKQFLNRYKNYWSFYTFDTDKIYGSELVFFLSWKRRRWWSIFIRILVACVYYRALMTFLIIHITIASRNMLSDAIRVSFFKIW